MGTKKVLVLGVKRRGRSDEGIPYWSLLVNEGIDDVTGEPIINTYTTAKNANIASYIQGSLTPKLHGDQVLHCNIDLQLSARGTVIGFIQREEVSVLPKKDYDNMMTHYKYPTSEKLV